SRMKRFTLPGVHQKLEQFERTFVFRTARGYFLFMALCAVLVFGGGLATGMWSFVKAPIPEPAPPTMPEPPPTPAPLDYAGVKAWVAEQERLEAEEQRRWAQRVR